MRIAVTCKHLLRDLAQYETALNVEPIVEVIAPVISGQQLEGDELVAAMAGVAGVIAGDDLFTADVLAALPDLRAISKWGIGLDGIDLDAAAARNITVTNTPGMFNDEVAEMALGYLIASVRGIVSTDRAVRRGEWVNPTGRSLRDKRTTIIGLGNIGMALAAKCVALGMTVRGVDPSSDIASTAESIGVSVAPLAALLPDTEILIVTCPLNAATQGLIGATELAMLPSGAHLINVGRGPVVQNAAVAEALSSGHLAGAALDVFEEEPLPASSELREFDNCILGTHNSSNTFEACHRTHRAAIANLFDALEIGA